MIKYYFIKIANIIKWEFLEIIFMEKHFANKISTCFLQ